MVWLDVTDNDGNSLYFVTNRIERLPGTRAAGFAVSGIFGDGCYEGEVIVEVGDRSAVTFVDAWLAGREFNRFAASIDRERVTAALTEVAEGLTRNLSGAGSPVHRSRRGERGGWVAEACPAWRAVA